MSASGHSRPMHSVPVPINIRCYSNSDIIVRRSEVTLRAIFDSLAGVGLPAHFRFAPKADISPYEKLVATGQEATISPHYSITSSARASSDDGRVRPSALAVFRLIANSYVVGVCTGRSAAFSPLRMRST